MASHLLWNGGDEPKLEADIWFVHGLRGDSIATWSATLDSGKQICWPRDLLKLDTPRCRIFSWQYDSSVANITKAASHATIFGHAESLLQDISMSRENEDEAVRPIMFVGHSLGGLVIKEALLRSSEYYHTQQDEDLGSVYACTKGIVFLGTPHRGSDRTPYGHIVAKVAKLLLRNPNEKLITLLEEESPILERQRRSFATISKDIGLACVIEELPTALGIIVPESSAVIDGFNVKYQQVPANHMDMCKFTGREEIGYKRVTFLIKNILKREFRATEQIFAVMVSAILMSLQYPGMDSREEVLDPAHRGTFSWIMAPEGKTTGQPSPFLQWLKKDESIFWLNGKAGSGKSTLTKFLVTHGDLFTILEEAFPSKRIIVAWHYLFERGKSSLQKSREGLVRHLLHLMISQNQDLARPIFRQQRAVRSFDYRKSWSWKELKTALEVVLNEKPADNEIILFIDGLDEYRPMEKLESTHLSDDEEEDSGSLLAGIISDGHQEISDLVLNISRFNNVKVCVSSRPFPVFRDTFEPFSKIALHDLTVDDISKYVVDRLAGNELLSQLAVFEPSFEADVEKEILAKADGVFLWVKLVLDLLMRGLRERDTVNELLQKLRSMPRELGGKHGLYMAMLRNLSVDNRKDGYKYFQMVQRSENDLDPLVLSFAMDDPLTTRMGKLTESQVEFRRKHTSDRLISRCGGLLEVRATLDTSVEYIRLRPGINFIHQTAKEFIMKQTNWEHLLPSAESRDFDGALALLRASVMVLKCSEPCYGAWHGPKHAAIWMKLEPCLKYARNAERSSATSAAELLLLVDRIMFNLCCPHDFAQSFTDFEQRVIKIFNMTRKRPSFAELVSTYITTVPDANVISPIHPYHWSVLEPGVYVSNPQDKNFIAVAIQSNLNSFLEIMSKERKIVETDFQRDYPMLAYALVPHRVQGSVIDQPVRRSRLGENQSLPDITRLLLELGQNPNQAYEGPAYLPGCTIWQGFLVYGDLILDPWAKSSILHDKEGDKEAYQLWLANARLLLEHGANPHATCPIRDQKLIGSPPRTYHHHSALYVVVIIIWRTARNQGWHEGLLEILVERGARLRADEMKELIELANMLHVPEPVIRSVSVMIQEETS